jgi:hypothetical protein
MQNIDFEESWQIVRGELPADLEQRARKTKFVGRMRGFGSVEMLTRLLLMHGSGLSLEQTALRAREHGLARISAVALHDRLKASSGFFGELCQFVQGGTSSAQISRWRASKEVADSLLSALRCPLPLKFLLANGARLRRRMKVLRPNWPLQIESLQDLLLS